MNKETHPLASLDEWEDDLLRRYPEPQQAATTDKSFRNYAAEARPSVKKFYELNHRFQTLDFVLAKRAQYLVLEKRRMGIWEAMEYLNTLIDDSDPDIELPQIEHLLQTAEAIRKAGRPRWYILTGLIHDLGKILCLWDEPQWAVVGDTFPVGCKFSEKIVFYEAFKENPDITNPAYQSELGIYRQHCGLDNVLMSWGHDEYLYHVVQDYLPPPALYMIRKYPKLMKIVSSSMVKQQRARTQQQLLSSAGIVCVSAPLSGPVSLVDAGRLMMNVWLELTACGYGVQPLTLASLTLYASQIGVLDQNFPSELYSRGREIVSRVFQLPPESQPIWMIRTGISTPLPEDMRTFRRSSDAILEFQNS